MPFKHLSCFFLGRTVFGMFVGHLQDDFPLLARGMNLPTSLECISEKEMSGSFGVMRLEVDRMAKVSNGSRKLFQPSKTDTPISARGSDGASQVACSSDPAASYKSPCFSCASPSQ